MIDNSVFSSKILYECIKYSGFSNFMTDNPQWDEWYSQIVTTAHIFFLYCVVSVQIKNFKLPLPEQALLFKNFCCSLLPVGLNGAGGEVESRKWRAEKLNSVIVSVLRPPWYHVLLEWDWILKAQCPQCCPEEPCETAFVCLLLHSPWAMEDLKFSHYFSHIYFCSSKNSTQRTDDCRKESCPCFAPCSAALMPPGWGTILLSLCKKSWSIRKKKKWSDLFSDDIGKETVHVHLLQKNIFLKLVWI